MNWPELPTTDPAQLATDRIDEIDVTGHNQDVEMIEITSGRMTLWRRRNRSKHLLSERGDRDRSCP
jgi:hypothetical protein